MRKNEFAKKTISSDSSSDSNSDSSTDSTRNAKIVKKADKKTDYNSEASTDSKKAKMDQKRDKNEEVTKNKDEKKNEKEKEKKKTSSSATVRTPKYALVIWVETENYSVIPVSSIKKKTMLYDPNIIEDLPHVGTGLEPKEGGKNMQHQCKNWVVSVLAGECVSIN